MHDVVIVIERGHGLNGDDANKRDVFDNDRLVHFVLIKAGIFLKYDVVVGSAIVSSNRRREPDRSGVREVRTRHIGFDCGAIGAWSIGPEVELGFETP